MCGRSGDQASVSQPHPPWAERMVSFRRIGAGKPLIVIHGFLGGAGVWLGQQVGLKRLFDVVAVDLPGFAGSPLGNAPKSMQAFVAEIMTLADSLKFEKFSLMGWSFGGMIAQQAALDHPHRIERLVLVGTAAIGELPQRFETWSQTLTRIASEGVGATLERTVRTWFVSGEADPFFRTCYDACKGASEAACANAINAMRPWTAKDRLGQIRNPTLVIVGGIGIVRQRPAIHLSFGKVCPLPICASYPAAHMVRTWNSPTSSIV